MRPDDGGSVLVDLGLARLSDSAGVRGWSNPYAAPELHLPAATATPEADAFAFAATLAHLLTGQQPAMNHDSRLDVSGVYRQLSTGPLTSIRPAMNKQICDVLAAPPEARPKNLSSWLNALTSTLSQVTTAPSEATDSISPTLTKTDQSLGAMGRPSAGASPPRRKARHHLAVIAVTALVVAVGVGGWLIGTKLPISGATTSSGVNATVSTATVTESAPAVAQLATLSGPTPNPVTVTTTATQTRTETAITTATQTATAAAVTVPNRPSSNSTYLVTLPVTSNSNNGTPDDPTKVTINGAKYQLGVRTYQCDTDAGGVYWQEYSLAGKYNKLVGVFRVDDQYNAPNPVDWQFIGDGKVLAQGSASHGAPANLDIPVAGINVLRLWINSPASVISGCSFSKVILSLRGAT